MKDTEAKLEDLRAYRDHAYAKAAEWNARGKEFDRKIVEVENLEILRVVRGLAASPEELRGLLNTLRAAGVHEQNETPPVRKEKTEENDYEKTV